MHNPKRWSFLVVGVLLMFALGCDSINLNLETVEVGELVTTTQTVALDEVETVAVSIKMGVGDLSVHGGTAELLDAEFNYNVAAWAPEVTYAVSGRTGHLNIHQPSSTQVVMSGNMRNEWTLALNEAVPLEVQVEHGVGTGKLSLGALQVRTVGVKAGAGDFSLDLGGNETLQSLTLETGVGKADLNLTGAWEHDVQMTLQNGVGETNIVLPAHLGVRVTISQGLGDVVVQGLTQRDGVYVNALYSESAPTLALDIQGGVGKITLTVAE